MAKKFLTIILFLLIFSPAAFAGGDAVNMYETPRDLPDKELVREDGKHFKLSDFKDEFVLAMFWSRHCTPCIKELDDINNFANKTKYDGIKVVLISPSQEWISTEEQRNFLNKYGATDLKFYVDEKSNLAADLGIFTSPNTVLVNKKGLEIGRIRGSADWDDDEIIEYIYKLKAKHG